METVVYEINTPQGELVIGKMIHGAALNCMIVPYDNPSEWYFKQFFSTTEIEQYAADHNLVIQQEQK